MQVPVNFVDTAPVYSYLTTGNSLRALEKLTREVTPAPSGQAANNNLQQQLANDALQESLIGTSTDNDFFAQTVNSGFGPGASINPQPVTPQSAQNTLNQIIATTLYQQILGLQPYLQPGDNANNNQLLIFSNPGLALLPDIPSDTVTSASTDETLATINANEDISSITTPANDNASPAQVAVEYTAADALQTELQAQPKYWVVA